jgi:hypothetical protein
MKGAGAGNAELALFQVDGAKLFFEGADMAFSKLVAVDFTHIRQGLASRGVKAPQIVLGADFLRPHSAVIDYAIGRLYVRKPQT